MDTHTLVWALSKPELLSKESLEFLGGAEVSASVACLWELLIKRQKPSALLADPLPWWDRFVVRAGIPVIGIRQSHVIALGRLPEHHRDPFDRILIAQAMVERATLVTKDRQLGVYGIPVMW